MTTRTERDLALLTLATARALRALLTHSVDAELTDRERLDYLAGIDEALRPFGPELPVNQEKQRT